ncbi:E3 ubiquitin ligase BIG BROTHER-related [Heracleum sosnowskyi]|uniref:E3 ubiquitin ligase BIG BROTHER-related n=1 Tax=Heracleum sosnowskyi TaxID=360622 RepID=A0AAD8I7L0_9APIA|nr:E3 ubiquitin ligase BIG BROTHER-related [Heracleum sosnowskyi]
MDNNHDSKPQSNAAKITADQNPPSNSPAAVVAGAGESNSVPVENNNDGRQIRTPFTDLSQVDADLALARTLQEQERAYMMIRMNGDVSDYGSWETGSFVAEDEDFDDHSEDESDGSKTSDGSDDHEHDHESDDSDDEDVFEFPVLDRVEHDDHYDDDGDSDVELNPADFPNDEAYARALQDAEDQELAARFRALSGLSEIVAGYSEELEGHGGNSQDAWEEIDPDNLSYEELLALGDVVGTESRGLSADTIASLPSMNFKMQSNQDGNMESCVICRLDYEEGDTLTVLSCRHSYHPECIDNWLRINKVCPVCSAEVSAPGNS